MSGGRLRLVMVFASVMVLASGAAQANTLYGSSRLGEIFTIDETTGAGTLVCSVATGATEIELDETSGTAFYQQPDGSFQGSIFDITTCATQPAVFDGHSFTGLEYIAGVLYGATIDGPNGPSSLRTLDPTTGSSTLIGLTGVGPLSGLAYDAGTATLYGVAGGPGTANLYTVSLGTGVATVVGNTGIQAGSLEFGTGGVLLAGGTGTNAGQLWQIDPTTGAGTLIGATGFATVTGLAFSGNCGNGATDAGEQCDDGNTQNGDCCSATCQFEFGGSPCELDSNECTLDTCDGAGTCTFSSNAPLSTPCEADANLCTQDHCDGSGACVLLANQPATTPCDADNDVCTTDECDGAGACNFVSNVTCQPANPPCEAGETCNPMTGCEQLPDPIFTPCDLDSDLCTNDFCDGAGNCSFFFSTFCNSPSTCDGGEVCNPATGLCDPQPDPTAGTPCETDGDPCSIDQCDGTGGCVLTSLPFGCVDHYLCYKTKLRTPFTPQVVNAVDQFETGTAEVKKPKDLCLPADKNGEGRIDPDTHEEAYQIKATPKHVRQLGVRMLDQFGQLTIDTVKADRLFVPTNKALGSDPSPPGSGVANHYKCYKAKITKGTPKFPKGVQASVVDQFESRTYSVLKLRHLCVPVDKNGEGFVRENGHLMCYKVKSAVKHTRLIDQVRTANQFGLEHLDTVKEDELCVPALKHVQNSPVAEDLTTCFPPVRDRWQFVATAGQTVYLKADTVDAGTAADLCFFGRCESGDFFSADDNVGCTFPPPGFSCPETSFAVSGTGTCFVSVGLCSGACADVSTALYSLTVTLDGNPAVLGLSDDDTP